MGLVFATLTSKVKRRALLNAGALLAEAAGATRIALHDVDYVPVRTLFKKRWLGKFPQEIMQ